MVKKKKAWKRYWSNLSTPTPVFQREHQKPGIWNVMSKFKELVKDRAEVSASQIISYKIQFLAFKKFLIHGTLILL